MRLPEKSKRHCGGWKESEKAGRLCGSLQFCFSDRRSELRLPAGCHGAVSGGRRMGGAGRSLVLRKPVEEGSLPNYQKAREAFLKADHPSQAGRVEQELVEYCLADDAARGKMQMEPLLAEFYG